MKNLFLKAILVVGLATTIVACSKDEETKAPLTIVGKWEVKMEIDKTTLNTTVLRNDTTKYNADDYTMEFKSNGTVISSLNAGAVLDTSNYIYDGTIMKIISRIDITDTTVFNNTSYNDTDLTLADINTQVNGSNTVISDYRIICKRK